MRTLAYVAPDIFGASRSNMPGLVWLNGLTKSRLALGAFCLVITGALGYLDYVTGYEQTFLLFYLAPIALARWFGDFALGFAFSVLSIAAWVVSDVVAGVPTVGLWNIGMALGSHTFFTRPVSKCPQFLQRLDS